jgi:hypothetical protein
MASLCSATLDHRVRADVKDDPATALPGRQVLQHEPDDRCQPADPHGGRDDERPDEGRPCARKEWNEREHDGRIHVTSSWWRRTGRRPIDAWRLRRRVDFGEASSGRAAA